MRNYHLGDRNLIYKAKGLLSFKLSLPDLTSISKESRDVIRSTLKELQDNHHLEIQKGDKTKSSFFVVEEYNSLTSNLINMISKNFIKIKCMKIYWKIMMVII